MLKINSIARTCVVILVAFTGVSVKADFQKSPNDHREYKAFELANRMQVLVISDPQTDEAAAALGVRIGGASDPDDRAGMAHYLEHMLFLGTKKYPELDGYRSFIEQNGGMTNAYTALDMTNYNFSIDPDYLKSALDRFSQFFFAPLFPQEQLERERAVVHAEYEMRTQRDAIIRWSAMRNVYNPKHPASKFISGTKETLNGDLDADLIEFFEDHYSANLMNFVVLGRESVDELENWVAEMFAGIKDSDAREIELSEPLFSPGQLPALLEIQTLKNNPQLTLMFPVPNLRPYWRESPDGYISNLLGHEGRGSLLSELKERGWADGLYVSPGDAGMNSYTMSVRISLTEDGFNNWQKAGAYVFQYIRKIRAQGIDEWRFSEQKILAEISYRFSEVDDPRNYVTFLASALHKYPRNEILSALYLVENYDPELIIEILGYLRPGNVMAVLTSPNAETDSSTPYIGANYAISAISDETINLWNTEIEDSSDWLPDLNGFLPQSLALKAGEHSEKPERIVARPGYELWHQTDTSFDVPRASFFVSVRSPVAKISAKNSVLLSLFTQGINDSLNEFAYPAMLAGLDYSLYSHSRGLSIRIAGYDDNQNVLLKEIVSAIKSPNFKPERFEQHRKESIREIENSRRDRAYGRTFSDYYSTVLEPFWTEEQELQALEEVSFDDLEQFAEELLEEVFIVALSHGNVLREESIEMGEFVASNLLNPQRVPDVPKSRVLAIADNGPYIRKIAVENDDSAILVYVQGADRSIEERSRFALLSHIIQTPFFSELRSVQQLGYVVFSAHMPVAQVPGIAFVIQSPDVDPEEMEAAISKFLEKFQSDLREYSTEEFEAFRNGLKNAILEKDTTLNDRTERYWTSIDRKEYNFDGREKLVVALDAIEKRSFAKFVGDLLVGNQDSRLIVLGFGKNHGLPDAPLQLAGVHITDLEEFKRSSQFFPAP